MMGYFDLTITKDDSFSTEEVFLGRNNTGISVIILNIEPQINNATPREPENQAVFME